MTEQKVISRQTGVEEKQYKWGFEFDIESDNAPRGLNEDIVRFISAKKNEPDWMLEWRLKAFSHWKKQGENASPKWAKVKFEEIDFQDIIYYSAPKSKDPKVSPIVAFLVTLLIIPPVPPRPNKSALGPLSTSTCSTLYKER